MASATSCKKNSRSEENQDLISNMPDIVIDMILERLPIALAAKTSVLSRNWRGYWLSLGNLAFDDAFWDGLHKDGKVNWEIGNNIISTILLNHNGKIHDFHLSIPQEVPAASLNISHWLSFLSRADVKKLTLKNWSRCVPLNPHLPSHVFLCKELIELKIQFFSLNSLPYDFKGFAYLRSLKLDNVIVAKSGVISSLIKHCPQLAVLRLDRCILLTDFVIEAPNLESLTIHGAFRDLLLVNVSRLTDIAICFDGNMLKALFGISPYLVKNMLESMNPETVKSLTNSNNLQCLGLNGLLCKVLAAGGITKSFPLALNSLETLLLKDMDLGDFDIYCYTLGLIQSCAFIKNLEISVNMKSNDGATATHNPEYYNDDFRLCKLLTVKFIGITGSNAELNLIEYLLSASIVLEKLFFSCAGPDPMTELKVSRRLLDLPRASTKARLVSLEQ